MFGLDVIFGAPAFLVLLLVLPALWWAGRKSLAGMSRTRAVVAAGLRTAVFLVLVFALAETQMRRTSQQVAVLYLLDQSLSIPAPQREAMFQFAARDAQAHRNAARGDRAGVIVFGREAAVEVPPLEADLPWLRRSEALVPHLAEATNLAAALKLAQSVFPPDSARRVVVVTDGNENLGAARQIAPQFASQGIGIDVVPIRLVQPNDVAVEKVILPAMAQHGETIEARVVVANNVVGSPADAAAPVAGKLRITRRLGPNTETLVEQDVELKPGKNVFPLVHTLDRPPGFYSYEAEFLPADPARERTLRNNRATAFTNIRGKGRVLLVENVDTPGEFDFLIQRLEAAEIDVEVRASTQSFGTLAELQSYDTVVLANVPRTSGDEAGAQISDEQIEALVRNTEMGSGLVMLGGPNSFGAGGWANTRLEEAMPVNFQIKNAKVVPSGGLVLVIDKSGSMEGEKIAMCRRAAVETVRVLSTSDHVGIVVFDSTASWLVPMQRIGGDRDAICRRISRLEAGGGTDIYPGMAQGFAALQPVQAAVKHMIVLSDGLTAEADFDRLVRRMRQANITVSTVGVGNDADRVLMNRIAQLGGGKFYHVTSPQAVPRIFIKEAMRVAKPLVYEREQGFSPRVVFPHEMLRGIDEPLPPIRGFVLTDVKSNPLVEVSLRSPLPAEEETSTVLASWNYGLGRSVAFTTDAGHRWAAPWTEWEKYDALFTQVVRWSMRPQEQEGDFLVSAEIEDGKIRAVVTALDKQREFLNFLNMTAQVTTPDLNKLNMPIRQVAPGRYVGELPAGEPGSYFLAINAGQGRGSILAGVNFPYSAEFDDHETNWPLLESLAAQQPAGGEPGAVIQQDLLRPQFGDLAEWNTFRPTLPPAVSIRDVWPLLAMAAACVFFFDVLMRRVAINPAALAAPLVRWLRRQEQPAEERIERLRSRKAEIAQQIDGRRAAARFEPAADAPPRALDEAAAATPVDLPRPPHPAGVAPGEGEDQSYTSRLLQAKHRLRQADKHKLPGEEN